MGVTETWGSQEAMRVDAEGCKQKSHSQSLASLEARLECGIRTCQLMDVWWLVHSTPCSFSAEDRLATDSNLTSKPAHAVRESMPAAGC